MCPLMSKAKRHRSTTDISSGCPNPPSGLRRQTWIRPLVRDEAGDAAGDTRPSRLKRLTNATYPTHRWCRIRRKRSCHTDHLASPEEELPLQVVLVPQASQPRSAHYTARSTYHADRKYEIRAPEADVEPYEFRPVCRPQCARPGGRHGRLVFLCVSPQSGSHARGRPAPGTPRGASGALGEAENGPPRSLRRMRRWDRFE